MRIILILIKTLKLLKIHIATTKSNTVNITVSIITTTCSDMHILTLLPLISDTYYYHLSVICIYVCIYTCIHT